MGNENNWGRKIKEVYTNKKELKLLALEYLILIYGIGVVIIGAKYGSLLIINLGVMISLGYSLKIFFSKKVF